MSIVRRVRAFAWQSLALLISWSIVTSALAQEFRNLLSADLSTTRNIYQGSTTNGNTFTNHARFQNISGIPFVITGVSDVQSLDPEDLGFIDLTLGNAPAARNAMAALYPDYDLYSYTGWIDRNPPRMVWETEITFSSPFPILVNPGDEFGFDRVSRNDRFGPDFGPAIGSQVLNFTDYIGEVVIAFDFDWHYVPEPSSASLLICSGFLGCLRSRRSSRRR